MTRLPGEMHTNIANTTMTFSSPLPKRKPVPYPRALAAYRATWTNYAAAIKAGKVAEAVAWKADGLTQRLKRDLGEAELDLLAAIQRGADA